MNTDHAAALGRFSVTTLSDALDTLGVNGGCGRIMPIAPGLRCAGRAYTVKFERVSPGEPAPAADYIDDAPEGSVILLDNGGLTHCTVWGDILSMCAQRRRIAGTVIHGLCRDVADSQAMGYPLFSLGSYMKSGKNRVKMVARQVTVTIGETVIEPGDYLIGNDDGVIAVPVGLAETVLDISGRIIEMEERVREETRAGTPLARARQIHGYNKIAARKAS